MNTKLIVCLLVVFVVGCAPLTKYNCQNIALDDKVSAESAGYKARTVSGLDDNGRPHRWCEYKDTDGIWKVWDTSHWYLGLRKGSKTGYTAEQLGYKTNSIFKAGKPIARGWYEGKEMVIFE